MFLAAGAAEAALGVQSMTLRRSLINLAALLMRIVQRRGGLPPGAASLDAVEEDV